MSPTEVRAIRDDWRILVLETFPKISFNVPNRLRKFQRLGPDQLHEFGPSRSLRGAIYRRIPSCNTRKSIKISLSMGGPRKNPNRLRAASASIRDVAQRAGVSIATVSRAVNGISTVAPELAERVWSAIEEVGYGRNTQARALVSGRSGLVGLVVSEITNPFFPELVQEFEHLAVEQGYEVFIGSTNYASARTEALIRRMLQRSVDGVAIMTFGIEEELVQRLVERAFPVVFVDAGPDLPNIRVLKVNYGEGIREAVQHLAALGHREIAFVSGPLQMRSAVARRDAFYKGMDEIGLPVPPEHIVEGSHSMEGGIA